jgi:hypothetical protein
VRAGSCDGGRDAHFESGLRSFFEYRDLGIKAATDGRVVAHVIRGRPEAAVGGHRWSSASRYIVLGPTRSG